MINKKLLSSLLTSIFTFSLYASDVNTSDDIPSLLGKRSLEGDKQDRLETPPKKRSKTFARPTYDTTFKHILTNDVIRLAFVRTFTGLDDITSTSKLDESLVPLKEFSELREIFDSKDTFKFLEWVNTYGNKIKVTGPSLVPGEDSIPPMGIQFLRDLSTHRHNLSHIFPKPRNSQLDILCQLSDKTYAMVEIQVAMQDFWDKRALAYLAAVYGRQLREGESWKKLRRVIGINLLVGGPKGLPEWHLSVEKERARPIRHYQFQDKHDPTNIISEMQLIQYSLGNADLDSDAFKDNKELYDWIDYFKNAHRKEEIPVTASDALRRAYQLVEIKNMGEEMRKKYEEEKNVLKNLKNYTEVAIQQGIKQGIQQGIERGIEQGREEGAELEKKNMAIRMLQRNVSLTEIMEYTSFSKEKIEAIKDESKKDER